MTKTSSGTSHCIHGITLSAFDPQTQEHIDECVECGLVWSWKDGESSNAPHQGPRPPTREKP